MSTVLSFVMNLKHKDAIMQHFSRTRYLILTVVCLTATLPAIRAELVYSQSFSNNSGGNASLSDYGWFGARSRGASETNSGGSTTVVSTVEGIAAGAGATFPASLDLNAVNPFGTNLAEGFVFMGTDGNNATRLIFHTPTAGMGSWGGGGADVEDLLTVAWAQRNQTETARTRVAIQVGAQWYISETVFTNSSSTEWTAQSLSFTPESAWHTLALQGNGAPDAANLGAPVAASTFTGAINNIGLYSWSPSGNNVRFDNFQVYAIPEPGSLILVGIAGMSLLILRRRG